MADSQRQVSDYSIAVLGPLLGDWVAEGESPVGPYVCRRSFNPILGGAFVQLDTSWEYPVAPFEERTIFGPGDDYPLQFFTFGSNGEQSTGHLVSRGGLSDEATVFESSVPTGRLRFSYWPTGVHDDVVFLVESASRGRWRRVLEHHYRRAHILVP